MKMKHCPFIINNSHKKETHQAYNFFFLIGLIKHIRSQVNIIMSYPMMLSHGSIIFLLVNYTHTQLVPMTTPRPHSSRGVI